MTNNSVSVVLLSPPIRNLVTAGTPKYVSENSGCLPSMGLLYLQASIEKTRHRSTFVDANLAGWSHDEAARQVVAMTPDVIGIQATTFTLPDAYLMAKEIKKLNPQITIVMGGPHPTIYPNETAALEAIDFSFAGEGEHDFIRFLDAFPDRRACAAVPGVTTCIGDEIVGTPSAGLLKDLDQVAYPARRSSKYTSYTSVLAKRNPITVMITSRGCPFQCVFCNRMGRKYRSHSAEYVLGEIDDIVSLGIGEIFIHDDTFSLQKDRVEAICNGLLQRKYDLFWEARTRVDCVDERLLNLMREAGCRRLSFGIESGSPKVLKAIRKGIDLARVRDVFKWCRKAGIVTLGDFLIGSLDETKEDIRMSQRLVSEIKPDYVQYSILSPFPGTPLHQIGLEQGIFARDVWADFAKDPLAPFNSPVWTQNFTEQELLQLTAQAYRRFYMRPGRIFKILGKMRSAKQLKNMASAALGMLKESLTPSANR